MRPSAQSEVVPRWNRLLPVRWLRRLLLDVALLPAFRQLVRLRVRGLDNLDGVRGPVIFAANHASHFDTPAVLAALPLRWRRKVAPAMSQDYFRRYFQSANVPFRLRLKLAAQYYMACGLFNAYPLPQQMAGTRRALKYTGELIDEGRCPLVYPEGERTPTGLMQTFKGGVGLMAARLGVPIVPIYIRGMFEVYSEHDDWPRPGNVVVHFGRMLDLQGDLQGDLPGHLHGDKSYSQAAARIEAAVRDLAKET
jgi:long-chain acyl-CoA synthetase